MMTKDDPGAIDAVWRTVGVSPDAGPPAIDLTPLVHRERRRRLIEIAISAAGLLVGLALMAGGDQVVGAVTCLYSVFGAAVGFLVRRASLEVLEQPVDSQLRAQIGRVRGGQYQQLAGALMMSAAAIFYVVVRLARSEGPVLFDAIVCAVLLSLALAYGVALSRTIAKRRVLETRLRQVSADD